MKRKVVGEVPGNVLGMLADLLHKLQHRIITPGQLGKFLKKENPFVSGDYSEIIAEWQAFWKKIAGEKYDLSGIVIPDKPEGKWRLLMIANIKLEALYAKCKEQFPCWRWTDDDLDKIITWNERDAKSGAYAIWVRDTLEADENLKNFSANDIKAKGITTETLAERLIHELKFFAETGKHLDIQNITLCSGSRYSDGDVPGMDFDPGTSRVFVSRFSPSDAGDDLLSREVVS